MKSTTLSVHVQHLPAGRYQAVCYAAGVSTVGETRSTRAAAAASAVIAWELEEVSRQRSAAASATAPRTPTATPMASQTTGCSQASR